MKKVREVEHALSIDPYLEHVPGWVARELKLLAEPLRGATVLHVNSTAVGGGVAEILHRLVPLQRGLGLDAHWYVIDGDGPFYGTTKRLHNTLQGNPDSVSGAEWDHYFEINQANLEGFREEFKKADFVIIHDPQPAAFLRLIGAPLGKWIWRCHIDLSRPQRAVWRRLRELVEPYHASVFSLAPFAQRLPHPQVLIPPAIDPLTDKNRPLEAGTIEEVCASFRIRRDQPLFVQVSRFDRFKDPVGVVEAFRILRRHCEASLVLVGGGAHDDPEGAQVLSEVRAAVGDTPDVHVLELRPDAHLEINALQRAATAVIQKSTKEGFGLTVTEALWKGKPVIGGAVGGITLQVHDGQTGYLVRSVEGCAYRMRHCLAYPQDAQRMGAQGVELVRGSYLITRQLRNGLILLDYLKDASMAAA